MRECSFEPRLTASRSQSRLSVERSRTPKGFDTIVQRLRVGYEQKQRHKEELEQIGRPKLDVKELHDEGGKTKIQPFNFMTDNLRPDRLKDKREGTKRQSVDTTAGFKFGDKNI